MTTPSEATLREMLDLDHEQARELKLALVAADGAGFKRVDETLRLADELMEAHGVEAIRGSGGSDDDDVALYVNTGDTYSGTLLYDVAKGRFYATTWGDWVEGQERAGRYIPNAGENKNKVIGTIGDVNPIEYGGGFVFETEHGPLLEYTHGLEGSDVDEGDEGSTELQLYGVFIEDDVLADLNWLKPDDLKSIAQSIGGAVWVLRKQSKSKKVMERANVYQDVAGHYGWENLDSYPQKLTARELSERWDLDTFTPNEASEMVSMDYGTMPTKKAFEKAFEREVGDDEYEIRLSQSDSVATEGTIIGDGSYDVDELYKGTKQLVKKFERGDDAAGDFASSILYTLGFEWI